MPTALNEVSPEELIESHLVGENGYLQALREQPRLQPGPGGCALPNDAGG
jgi:hypothetical protein